MSGAAVGASGALKQLAPACTQPVQLAPACTQPVQLALRAPTLSNSPLSVSPRTTPLPVKVVQLAPKCKLVINYYPNASTAAIG